MCRRECPRVCRKLSSPFISPPGSRIIEGKEKDDPKTVPLKIFAKDIGNCAYVRRRSSPGDGQQYRLPGVSSASGQSSCLLCSTDVQAKTLAVGNMDTTSDVIRMALLQFGISVRDQTPVLAHGSGPHSRLNTKFIVTHCIILRTVWFLKK